MKRVMLSTLFYVLGLYSYAQFGRELRTIRVYPNPSSGLVQVSVKAIDNKTILLRVHDTQGRVIDDHSSFVERGDNLITIDVTDHPSGCYHITMHEEEAMVAHGRFLKY